MSITPPALVAGAPRPPLPFGLFSVLAPREGSADRWEAGVQFEQLGCPPLTGGLIGPYDCEETTEGLPKSFDGHWSLGTAAQFTIYESQVCSPIGNGLDRSTEIASQRLALFEEFLVERKLWEALDGLDTSFPVSTADLDVALDALVLGIAELEDVQGRRYGTQGVLHMSRLIATLAIRAKVVEARQNRLYTVLGTPVIAGSGYGEENEETGTKVVLTPQMFGYRSEVFTSSNRPGDLLDRDQNDLYGVAERNWLIGFDDICIEVEPDPEPEPEPEPEP